jgi:hypothetical protein
MVLTGQGVSGRQGISFVKKKVCVLFVLKIPV